MSNDEIDRLRQHRRRVLVRAGLTTDLNERAILQASAAAISNDIQAARSGNLALRAAAGEFEGGAIVLLADKGEVEYADGGTAPLHCTVAYFGPAANLSPLQRADAGRAVDKIADNLTPFTPTPLSPARFGDDDVLLVEHPSIQRARDIVMADSSVAEMVRKAPDAHPHFIPHVSGTDRAPRFDRVGLWLGPDRTERPFNA